MKKVFGIGLSKTATTSLNGALRILGYRAIHFPFLAFRPQGLVVDPSCLNKHDAFTDTPVANCFKYLDRRYPEAKFVYTIREKEAWLRSCEKHWSHFSLGFEAIFNRHFKVGCLQYSLYRCFGFDRDKFAAAYERHDERVKKYFRGREDDLLTLNITNGEGWDKLCGFLDKPVPSKPFPESNVTAEKEWG